MSKAYLFPTHAPDRSGLVWLIAPSVEAGKLWCRLTEREPYLDGSRWWDHLNPVYKGADGRYYWTDSCSRDPLEYDAEFVGGEEEHGA